MSSPVPLPFPLPHSLPHSLPRPFPVARTRSTPPWQRPPQAPAGADSAAAPQPQPQSQTAAAPGAAASHDLRAFGVHSLPVPASMQQDLRALVGIELGLRGPIPLAIAPHDSVMLTLQFGRDRQPIEQKGVHGLNTFVTGIRQWTGSFQGAGDCVTLFALLTPLGAMRLLESRPLDGVPRILARAAELLDERTTRALESDVALAQGLDGKLRAVGHWLESRGSSTRRHSSAALRAARAAMRLCGDPNAAVETLADEQHVSRRQLERDFRHWLGTSPRHLSQVARLQGVSRRAGSGASLADIAAEVGFADQAHMSRVVRQLTGLTPRRFVQSRGSPLSDVFRRVTGGATVYL